MGENKFNFVQGLTYVMIFIEALVVVPIYLDVLMGHMHVDLGFGEIFLIPPLVAFSFLTFAWYMSERNEAKETGKQVRWWDHLLGVLFGVIPMMYILWSIIYFFVTHLG